MAQLRSDYLGDAGRQAALVVGRHVGEVSVESAPGLWMGPAVEGAQPFDVGRDEKGQGDEALLRERVPSVAVREVDGVVSLDHAHPSSLDWRTSRG